MKAVGIESVNTELDNVTKKIQKKATKKGVNAATKIVARAAKDRVIKKTGLLKRSIGRKVKVYKSGTTVGIVGPRVGFAEQRGKKSADPAKYGHLVEKGTQPHSLLKGASIRKKRGVGQGRMHPGARAQPFMKPALDDNAQKIKDAVAQAIKEVLNL